MIARTPAPLDALPSRAPGHGRGARLSGSATATPAAQPVGGAQAVRRAARGPAGDLQLQRAHAAGAPAGPDPRRRRRGRDLLLRQHRQHRARSAAVASQLQRAAAAEPDQDAAAVDDRPGGRPGAPPARRAVMSEKQLGQSAQCGGAVRGAGRGAGRNLAGAGLNVNLAPVLDVYRSPGNFIDEFGRSYSNRASHCRRGSARTSSAPSRRVRVAATAKHFPGLGAAARRARTPTWWPVTLRAVAVTPCARSTRCPIQAAIKAGGDLVMVSWATYPALDADRPAGLSARSSALSSASACVSPG